MRGARAALRRLWEISVLLVVLLGAIAAGVILDRTVLADAVPMSNVSAAAAPHFRLMAQAWNLIRRNYVDQEAVQPQQMTWGAISGMVESLGDVGHSSFLTPQMLEQERDIVRGRFAGIGATIRSREGRVVVVAPMDDSPAKRSGLRAGDVIVSVDGEEVTGLPLLEVVQRIRGPAGSTVRLGLQSPDGGRTRTVLVTRAEIPVISVSWSMVPGSELAHVRIARFSRGVAGDLDTALGEARARGARAVILDLRNDPGGLLEEAIGVASRFLDGGKVLIRRDAEGNTEAVPVDPEVPKWRLPMNVLINAGTASAAEIVSGALRDAGRARLVGEKTFGTGTVLRRFTLSDGSALLLAIEEWLTPRGNVIWHQGIEPDVGVALPEETTPLLPREERDMSESQLEAYGDAQLERAAELLRGNGPGTARPPEAAPAVRAQGA